MRRSTSLPEIVSCFEPVTSTATCVLIGPGAYCRAIIDAVFELDPECGATGNDSADATMLFRSIQRLLALPPETRMFLCHDHQLEGRELALETTVGAQRADNILKLPVDASERHGGRLQRRTQLDNQLDTQLDTQLDIEGAA